ncbi:MAG TPA: sterol carrier family protein [Candidatus Nanopelagicales bacterium]|nr:sterol carrier family protein [Candidatus Nanopelagicales bacterium]
MTEPHEILAAWDAGDVPERAAVKDVVKRTLATLVEIAPGRAVEVRVPPYAAVQAVGGTTHRRGTPPAVVECDARTWLGLATGAVQWSDAVADGRVRASGERSDLGHLLPLPLSHPTGDR